MIRATVDHLAPPNYFNDEIEEDPYADDVEGNVLGKDLICKFFSDEVAELQEEIMEAHLAYTVWFLKKTPEGRKHMEEMEVARARKKSLPNKLVPTDIGKALQTSNDQVRYLWLPLTKVINDNGSDDGIEFTNKLKFISWKLVAAFCRIGPKYIFKQAAFSVHSQLGALAAASVMNLSQPLSWPLFIFGPRALMAFEVAFRITSVEKKIQTEVLSNPPGYVVDDAVIIQRIAFQAFQIADHLDPEEEPVSSLPLFSRTPIPFGSEFRETGGRGISLDDLRIANHVTKKEREVLEEIVRGITKETPPEELLNESIILAMSNSEGCAEYAINRIRQEDHAFRKLTDKVNEMSGKKIGIKTRLENELASLAGSRAEYKHALCRYDTISQQTEFMRAQVAQARANQYSQAPAQSYQTPAHGYQQPAQQFQSLAHSYQAPAHGFQTPAQNYQTPDFKDPLSRQNYQLNIPGPITGRYHPPQQCPMPQGYDSGPYGQWRASLALDPMQPRPLDMPPAGPKRSPSAQLTQEQTRDTLRPRGGANSESLPAATPKFPARSSTANSEPLPAASMVQNINQFLKRGMGSTAPPNGEDGGVGREDSEE